MDFETLAMPARWVRAASHAEPARGAQRDVDGDGAGTAPGAGAGRTDGTTRVIVLRGAGGHFCAGGDIKDMAAARMKLADNPNAIAEVNAAFGDSVRGLCQHRAGGGGGGRRHGDGRRLRPGLRGRRDAGRRVSVVFRLPETSPGRGAGAGRALPGRTAGLRRGQAAGRHRRQGRRARRCALRLVHEVHADAEALDWALQRVLADILHCAPGALAATKALIAKARLHSPASLVHEAAETFARAALGPEGQEGTLDWANARRLPAEAQGARAAVDAAEA
jgi:isohexenylglutaconyl-CoA hydratase